MRERIPNDEFIERAKRGLAPLIGMYVKVTVRVATKRDLRTYSGELVSVNNETFTLRQPVYENGSIVSRELFEYRLIDLHYYVPPDSFHGKWVPPIRYRRP